MAFLDIIIVLATFLAMEGATWLIHKYIMHGILWHLHKDHHRPAQRHTLERNDYFFVLFAAPTIFLMWRGAANGFDALFFVGSGVALYGMGYFFVHDIFIHQRLPLLRTTRNPYLLAIRRAHKQHHRHLGREGGECFGFLWVPVKYFRMYFGKAAG